MVDRGRGWPISMRFHRGAAAFFRSLAAREKGENAFKSDSDLDSAFPLVLQSLMRVLNKMPRETRREERGNAPPLRLLRPSVERGAGMREPEDESERRSRVLRGPHPRSAAAEEKPGTTTADDACICILNTLDISSRPTKLSASSSYSVPSFFSWFLSRNLLSRYSILLGEFSTTTVVETSAKDSKGEENLHFSNYAFRERRVALAAPTRADLPPRRLSQRARIRIKTIRDVLTSLPRGSIEESLRSPLDLVRRACDSSTCRVSRVQETSVPRFIVKKDYVTAPWRRIGQTTLVSRSTSASRTASWKFDKKLIDKSLCVRSSRCICVVPSSFFFLILLRTVANRRMKKRLNFAKPGKNVANFYRRVASWD